MTEVKELSRVLGLWFSRALVAQVALELFLGGEVQAGEPLEDMVDRTMCAMLLTGYATFTLDWLLGVGSVSIIFFLLFFFKKKQDR